LLENNFNVFKIKECKCEYSEPSLDRDIIVVYLDDNSNLSQGTEGTERIKGSHGTERIKGSINCINGTLEDVIQIIKNRNGDYLFKLKCNHGNKSSYIKQQLLALGYNNIV